ncbi:hypothetical protein ACLEPN_31200 [Myxococcus sp. 1LA]
MSMVGLVVGVVAQLMFAFVLFMLVVFSAGGTLNNRELTPLQGHILDHCMWLVPGSSVVTAALLVVGHLTRASWLSHAWHLLPVATAGVYVAYVSALGRRPRARPLSDPRAASVQKPDVLQDGLSVKKD